MHIQHATYLLALSLHLATAFPSSTHARRDLGSESYSDLAAQYGADFMDHVGWVPGVIMDANKDAAPAAPLSTGTAKGDGKPAPAQHTNPFKNGTQGKPSGRPSKPTTPGKSGKGWKPLWEPTCCETTNTEIPIDQVQGLPAPKGKLVHVLLGRGTQNYTCDPKTPTAAPTAVGAVAHLYNATCIAASSQPFLRHLAPWAFSQADPHSDTAPFAGKASLTYVGRHYFTADGVPKMDLGQEGQVLLKKAAAADAPKSAAKNSVQWLQLTASPAMGTRTAGEMQAFSEVYRVYTAGGDAPATCKGQKKNIQVEYAATYWFYQ